MSDGAQTVIEEGPLPCLALAFYNDMDYLSSLKFYYPVPIILVGKMLNHLLLMPWKGGSSVI